MQVDLANGEVKVQSQLEAEQMVELIEEEGIRHDAHIVGLRSSRLKPVLQNLRVHGRTGFSRESAGVTLKNHERASSIVIPLQLQHHFIHRRGQLAEVPLRTEPQPEVARQLPLLIEADVSPHFAIGEVIALGFQAEVTQWIAPQHTGVEPRGWGNQRGEIVVVLDSHRSHGEAQHVVPKLPRAAARRR